MDGGIASEALIQGISRIERLEEEKKALGADIKSVYDGMKSQGFDVKIIRKLVVLRRQTEDERSEERALLDLYMAAIGMSDGQPLSDRTRDQLSRPKSPPPHATRTIRPTRGDGLSIRPDLPSRRPPRRSTRPAPWAGRRPRPASPFRLTPSRRATPAAPPGTRNGAGRREATGWKSPKLFAARKSRRNPKITPTRTRKTDPWPHSNLPPRLSAWRRSYSPTRPRNRF
ncbi:hypothetical protein K678_13583 [Magnetospirillum fulvum MGU-K5]|uniref:GapR-like DNA-binding domain-containing protein n=1 Tax=Magnetospirillum fulvum MGU-K5 TaxID=1316936 RepID=S9TF82_MAGFU|nr:hypothetical protein K678_13583 [Magnetospirillum fulvum MGU-K5]